MFEMEEGGPKSEISSQASSSSTDLDRLSFEKHNTRPRSKSKSKVCSVIHAMLQAADSFCLPALAALRMSRHCNGNHCFLLCRQLWGISNIAKPPPPLTLTTLLQRERDLCSDHYLDLPRRIPRRFPPTRYHTHIESIRFRRCLSKIHAP